jgi:hypothetical protein
MKDLPYEKGKGIGDQIIREAGKKNRSGDWYSGRLRQILGELQKDDINLLDTGGIEVGKMYFFIYGANSPKLSFFDRQPLTYITEINYNQGYFIGINLHYVGRQYREGLAKSLINKSDTVGVPRNTIHRYFFSGVAGGFLRVPEKDWPSVALLPTEKFVDMRGQSFPNHKAWSKP